MASQGFRKVSPSICLRPGTDLRSHLPKPALPKRPSPKTARTSSGRFELVRTSTLTNRVRFEDENPLERETILEIISSAQNAPQVEPATRSPPRQFQLGAQNNNSKANTSSGLIAVENEHVPDGVVQEPISNPFVDPESASDLPELCEDDDPFRDADSVTSHSEVSNSAVEVPDTNPDVRIVDLEKSLPTPSPTPPVNFDLKDEQAYFSLLERFHHPEVARQQFRERQGHMWFATIPILMAYFLHPVDLTESEFVELTLSQGNATSNWLSENTRKIASRSINQKKEWHKQLSDAGLPPSRLTDEFVEIYGVLGDGEKRGFMDYIEMVKEYVQNGEKCLNLSGVMLEKFQCMDLPEKCEFINQYKSNATEAHLIEQDGLWRMEKELADIKALISNRRLSGTESTQSLPSDFGTSLQQINLIDETEGIAQIFGSLAKSSVPAVPHAQHSRLRDVPSTSAVLHAKRSFSSAGAAETENSLDLGAGIEEAEHMLPAAKILRFLKDDHASRFAKVKKLIRNSVPKSIHAFRRKDTHVRLEAESDDTNAASSRKVADTLSTARKGIVMSPNVIHISPPSSVVDVAVLQQGETSRLSEDSGIGMLCKAGVDSRTPAVAGKFETEFSSIISPQSKPTELEAQNIRSVSAGMTTAETRDFSSENHKTVRNRSFWTLKPRQRKQALETPKEVHTPAHADTELLAETTKLKQTLRKKLSTVFGATRKHKGTISECDLEQLSVGRKMFGRKSLPEWEFSR